MSFKRLGFIIALALLLVLEFWHSHPNQIARVEYSFTGCMGYKRCQLILYKKEGQVFAQLNSKGEKQRLAKLNSPQLDSFKVFVSQLRKIDESYGCTNEEAYKVYLPNETIQRVHRKCRWYGFEKLKNGLFQ